MNGTDRYLFRLYIAGGALSSAQALANLTAICRSYVPDRHEIEVVDVLLAPKRALEDGILMTPTLLKLAPSPMQRIVGTLGQAPLVLFAIGLDAFAA